MAIPEARRVAWLEKAIFPVGAVQERRILLVFFGRATALI